MKTLPLIPFYHKHCELKGMTPQAWQPKGSVLNRFAQAFPELPTYPVPIFRWLGTVGNSFGTRLKARKVLSAFYTWVCASYEIQNPIPQVSVPKRRAKNGTPLTTPPHPPHNPLVSNTAPTADGDTLEDRIAQKVTAALIQGTPPFAPYAVGSAPELRTEQALNDYLVECRTGAKPKSELTISWELAILNRLKDQYPVLPMDGNTLGRFIGTATSRKHRHTFSRILVTFYGTLSRLYGWKRQGIFNPTDRDEMQRVSEEKPEAPPLQADELERVLGALPGQAKDVRLCHLLLMTTGFRPIELVNLTTADFFDTQVQVKGKTKPRLVELIPDLAAQLRELAPKSGAVFAELNKRQFKGDSVRHWTKTVLGDAGVRDGLGGGRLFRHSFACWLYTETGDLKLVKDVLGHTNLAMSEHYAKQRMSRTAAAPLWYDLIHAAATCHKQEKPEVSQAVALLINGVPSRAPARAPANAPIEEGIPAAEMEAYIRQYGTDEERRKLPNRYRLDTGASPKLL